MVHSAASRATAVLARGLSDGRSPSAAELLQKRLASTIVPGTPGPGPGMPISPYPGTGVPGYRDRGTRYPGTGRPASAESLTYNDT
eukprot:3597596-Rhodomonas_salina.1